MYLTKAIFINRASLGDMMVDYEEKGINVLTAINGKGKTTIITYIFDALYGMAKGFANYAAKNQCIGRVQMIREVSDASGKKYKRLDLTASAVRPKVLNATTNDELNHIFNEDGLVMNE